MSKLSLKQPTRNGKNAKLLASLSLALLISLVGVCRFPKVYAQDLSVKASFADKPSIAPNERIDLHLNRPLQSAEGRLAVLIGQTDLTAFFTLGETTLSYTPKFVPLPAGENQVTVYLVSQASEWKVIAQFALKVGPEAKPESDAAPTGEASTNGTQANGAPADSQAAAQGEKRKTFADKIGLQPSLTVGLKSQPAESHFPDANAPARARFTDATLQSTFRTEMKNDRLGYQSQFEVAGSSFQQEALRFGQLGREAPRLDLSSYLMQFNVGKTSFQAGHIAVGTNRHLINSFSSRGLSLTVPLSPVADFSLAAMNGTSIVGYDNFFGLNRRKHQIVTGTLGFELLPKRAGALRLETAVMHGSLQPISNFNQGNVTDAEQSKGLSFRVVTSDAKQRFKLDGGFARSHFNNANDPLLNLTTSIVATRPVTRNAEYVDATYNLLQNVKLTASKQANLAFNLRHERVDPLFRSVAASTQADRLQNQFEMVAALGEFNATVSHQRGNDNLSNIPSILKTAMRRDALVMGAPLASFLSRPDKPSPWLPRLAYMLDRTHQFADNTPVNGGFSSASQLPDQLSLNQLFSSEWQVKSYRFAYRFNRSLQDNRQPGRELADLTTIINGVSIGLPALGRLDVTMDVNAERANNRENRRTDRTLRITTGINYRMTDSSTFAANLSATGAGDLGKTARARNAEFDVQWAYKFVVGKERFKKLQGQFFIRYANRYASSRDNLFGFSNLTKAQTLNTGLSFTFF
jgi:hypothetical protein